MMPETSISPDQLHSPRDEESISALATHQDLSDVVDTDWHSMNHAHLLRALDELKSRLREAVDSRAINDSVEGNSHPAKSGSRTAQEECLEVDFEPASALDQLCTVFHLTPFERNVLLLCAGCELDSEFGSLCSAIHGDPARAFPTWGLSLALFPGAHWSALTPSAPLRFWRIIETGAASGLTTSRLKIDERILHCLIGASHLDSRLAAVTDVISQERQDELSASHVAVVEQVIAIWSLTTDGAPAVVIELCGTDAAECRSIAIAVASALGRNLAVIAADQIPAGAELDLLIRLWDREWLLDGPLLLVEGTDPAKDLGQIAVLQKFLERVTGPVLVSGQQQRNLIHRPAIRIDVERPGLDEQRVLWRTAFGLSPEVRHPAIESAVAQFHLGWPSIRSAAAETMARISSFTDPEFAPILWEACRKHTRVNLERLVQRVTSKVTWNDLILPPAQSQAIRRIAEHVRHRSTVYEQWGFSDKGGRGLGISALFSGASGTGKTLAAEVLANELRLDLFRIDLSSVVSKYIGETEKNLRRVFDAAESGAAILLFDEADALFGKRSEVKDSHDRHANIEVSYLLQRMESYRGLAILTTNQKNSLDPAFLRRLRFVIEFPLPDTIQRAEIWRQVFPDATPTDSLDYAKLARINIPGGNIRNIALNAAFVAAAEKSVVCMSHIKDATRSEFLKLERPMSEADVADWT